MITVKGNVGEPHETVKSFNMLDMVKIRPQDGTARLTVSVSHLLPGGGSAPSSSERERVYYLLSGSVTVRGKNEEHLLEAGDLIYVAPDEERSLSANGVNSATMLVIAVDVW